MSLTAPPPVVAPPEPKERPVPPIEAPPARRSFPFRLLALALLALWALMGFYVVPPDEEAVETLFGAVNDPRVSPGVHYNPPWPAGRVHRLKVRQMQRAVVGGELADSVIGQADPLLSQFLTGDQNIIHVRTIVQYSVADPQAYLFRAQDVDSAVRSLVEAELGRQIAVRSVDDVLTTGKTEVQEAVRQRAQALADRYELGVVLATVNIESVGPPPEAADAFRDVASARADSARIVSEAEGYANDLVPRARGEAQRLRAAAEGYRESNVNQALGDAARFTALAQEYESNPEVTRRRLYLETLDEVLPRLKKTVVDDAGNLDLTIVRRESRGRAPSSAGGAP